MKNAIECFFVSFFLLMAFSLIYILSKPYIEKKDETTKKKWLLIIRIDIILGYIVAIYLFILGVLIITGIWK